MPDWTPFENYVQGEKQNRLPNEFGIIEQQVFDLSFSHKDRTNELPNDITNFFQSKNYQITPETMREAIGIAWMADGINKTGENRYPNISEDNIDLDKFPASFASPLELTSSIGDYIKSNMSYDLLSAMQQRDNMIGDTETNFSWAVENITKTLNLTDAEKKQIASIHGKDDVLATLANLNMEWGKFDLSDGQIENMKPILAILLRKLEYIQPKLSSAAKLAFTQLMWGVNQLQQGLQTKNKAEIKDALTCTPHLSQMVLQGAIQGNIDMELNKKADIGEYLKDIKVGVCRHFSMIAKMFYNKLKDRITADSESELIFVGQEGKQDGHAYNLLMRTEKWPDGKEVIKKKYIDITSYIGWNALFKEENGFFGSNKEVWVNINNKDDNRANA
jgi:hypothetical protein